MRPRLLVASLAAATAAVAVPAPAQAVVPWHVVAHPSGYVSSEIYIASGNRLFLVNADTNTAHDLRSDRVGSNGRPIFSSALIDATESPSEVVGVADLLPGDVEPFYCSVHFFMVGNVRVLPV